jgi:tRNA 2-thiouridine synthesizing protein A
MTAGRFPLDVVVDSQQNVNYFGAARQSVIFGVVCRKSVQQNHGRILMSDTLLDTEIMEFHKELDARGLNCPLPILKAKKALSELQSGEVLRIMATDPGSVRDFQAFAKQTGNALLSHVQTGREFVFLMQRK